LSDDSTPLLVQIEGGIGRLTLNRPEKRNALDRPLVLALLHGLAQMEADDAVTVVTIEGAGDDFCAGADLAELEVATRATVPENIAAVSPLAELFVRIRTLRKPVVALVRGRALAGGCGLAVACDLVLASESAHFGFPETSIGFVPAMVTAILRRNVSEKRAFAMVALGETYSATEAERFGLISRVYPEDRLSTEGMGVVRKLAGRSATAVMLSKRLLYEQETLSFDSAIQMGAYVNVIARTTESTREGVKSFLNKRG
jgi:methylglutaconyl-CoA hydratase